jgi:hypothetical protein
MRPPRLIPILTLGLACTAGGEPAGNWVAERDTVGDTIVVRTVSGSVGAAQHQLVPELSIGVFEGPDEHIFGAVGHIAVAPAGDMYVYDWQVPVIRRYDHAGTYVRNVGRGGEGPGEYRQISGMEVLPDGRLLTWDPRLGRVSVFANDSLERSWQAQGGTFSSRALTVDTSGHVVLLIRLRSGPDDPFRHAFVRCDLTGTLIDSVVPPDSGFVTQSVRAVLGDGRSRVTYSVPFSPRVTNVWSPLGYLVSGVSDRYALTLVGASDRPFRIERDAPPVPVGSQERAQARDGVVENIRRSDQTWRWSGADIPATKPAYRVVMPGRDGRLWVRTSRTAEPVQGEDRDGNPVTRWVEPTVWDVFEPGGRYLGEVAEPDGTNLMVVHGDMAWGVQSDSLDVQRVVRFRIEPPLGR